MNEAGIKDAVSEIHEILQREAYGCQNDAAKNRILRLGEAIKHDSDYDTYIMEKLASLASFVDVLYSPRKHYKYQTESELGAERVKQIVYNDAANIKRWLGSRKNMEQVRNEHTTGNQ